jgi:multiple sugar transport system permease protein
MSSVQTAHRRTKTRALSRVTRSSGPFFAFVAPSVAIFSAFVLVPIIWTVVIGLTNERASRPITSWVWFDNYATLLADPSFLQALGNTVELTIIVVLAANGLGVALALLLQKSGRLYRILRSIYFTPVILSSVVVSVIWRSVLVDDGLLNTVLRSFGVAKPPGWLSDPALALGVISVIMVWQTLGFAVVIYVAGLSSVPEDLEEAANLDGAGPVARFRHITWPLLAPSLTITTVMVMISTFKTFDQIAVLTNGGPGTGSTTTVAFDVIHSAFTDQRAGYASAMASIMLLVVGLATVIVLRLLQRREVTF